jgi:hypothetical protein
MSCELNLFKNDDGRGAYKTITDTGYIGDTLNNSVSAVKIRGYCSDTAWVLFENKEGEGYGKGIIIGKGDPYNKIIPINNANHHGEGKDSENHRFYNWDNRVSFVQRVDIPNVPNSIKYDIEIYGKRDDTRKGQWGHYPYFDASDLANPNNTQQWIVNEEQKGQPCPGGQGFPIGHRQYRCIYPNAASISQLAEAVYNRPTDPRTKMHEEVVQQYCSDIEKFPDVVGRNGRTCEYFGASREEYCRAVPERIKTHRECTKTKLGKNKYVSVANSYCQAHPTDEWCKCYNLVNKVCDTNMEAFGCKAAHEPLDGNKEAFGNVKELEDAERAVERGEDGAEQRLAEVKAKNGYSILKEKVHCRPNACDSGYIPPNSTTGCAASYRICDEDMDIRAMSNSDIIIACNKFKGLELEEGWDKLDPSFAARRRKKKPIWKKPEFIAFSSSLCCLIILFMMSRLKKR